MKHIRAICMVAVAAWGLVSGTVRADPISAATLGNIAINIAIGAGLARPSAVLIARGQAVAVGARK